MFLDKVEESPSLELVNLILKMKAEGKNIVSLGIGDPSFDTPREIIEVAYKSMLQGDTHYVHSYGTLDVRQAIRAKVARKNGIRAGLENTIFMATKMAVYAALSSVSSRPFEALMPDPGYFYSEPIILAGGKPVYYKLSSAFGLDVDEVKKKIGPKTKAIMVNTPSNPTGTMIGKSELRELYEVCADRGVYILSDEAYEDLVFTKKEHVSVGSLEKRPGNVISLYSLSKSYSMTGWRAGYIVGPEKLISLMNKFVENAVTCFPPFIEHASAYALENGDQYIRRFRTAYLRRLGVLKEEMSRIPQLEGAEVEGSFYSFPSYTGKLKSQALCMRLMESQNVALLPGAIFGPSGEKHLRICFASSEETIRTAMHGLRKFFADS
ncbi:MAG: aminotransferase class I/II-fold pyridoxal phosphate-dependent enzyme [Thaumarchaeota archaeon]|nr:aminotransferase class I/II-fold pyridoxal phosphate-dependent enzyme [Nitrososphaerota archaeon]